MKWAECWPLQSNWAQMAKPEQRRDAKCLAGNCVAVSAADAARVANDWQPAHKLPTGRLRRSLDHDDVCLLCIGAADTHHGMTAS